MVLQWAEMKLWLFWEIYTYALYNFFYIEFQNLLIFWKIFYWENITVMLTLFKYLSSNILLIVEHII